MNTNGHYAVKYYPSEYWGGARRGQVHSLNCVHCAFYVAVVPLHRQGDKSGAGRYCRARMIMVKHLHEKHRDRLAAGDPREVETAD